MFKSVLGLAFCFAFEKKLLKVTELHSIRKYAMFFHRLSYFSCFDVDDVGF